MSRRLEDCPEEKDGVFDVSAYPVLKLKFGFSSIEGVIQTKPLLYRVFKLFVMPLCFKLFTFYFEDFLKIKVSHI